MNPRDDDGRRDETDPDQIGRLDRGMLVVKLVIFSVDQRVRPSSQIALDEVDELLGCLGLSGRGASVWIHYVEAHVALDDFGHEAIDGPTARRDRLQDRRALLLIDERLLDAVDLPSNTPNAIDELLLVPDRVRHSPSILPVSIGASAAPKTPSHAHPDTDMAGRMPRAYP